MADQFESTPAEQSGGFVLRTIPLSAIVVREDHNPRTRFDDRELARLAHAMTTRGFQHPLLVKPGADPGTYELVDGERRLRAAQQAALDEVPALVKTSQDTSAGDLLDALLANDLAQKLDVVDEASAYQRLITDGGLTRKGVAQACRVPVERVRERLQILALPDEVQRLVAAGAVPLMAVKPLAELAQIHAELPAVAVRRVADEPLHQWDSPTTWEDLCADPVGAVIGRYDSQRGDLPADVFVAGAGYPVTRFSLDARAQSDLPKLCALLPGVEPETFEVRFDRDAVEHAARLHAAHASAGGFEHLIVGEEVAAQLAGDYVRACLKVQRRNDRLARDAAKAATAVVGTPDGAGTPPAAQVEAETPEQQAARRRAEREAEQAAREAAWTRNEQLGTAIVKHLSKVKIDDRVLRVLTAAPLDIKLGKIAERGARLGFPGWVTRTERKNGTTKVEVLDGRAAEAKAREYLDGAKGAPDVAGRALALLAMARWADESPLPQSSRSYFELRFGGYGSSSCGVPWSDRAGDLLDEILVERLPHEACEPIRTARAERERQRENERRRDAERDAAVTALAEAAPTLTTAERQEQIAHLRAKYGWAAVPAARADELLALPEPTSDPESLAGEADGATDAVCEPSAEGELERSSAPEALAA